MESLKVHKAVKLEGNVAESWRKWKQCFELYITETEEDASGKYVIGPEALEAH